MIGLFASALMARRVAFLYDCIKGTNLNAAQSKQR